MSVVQVDSHWYKHKQTILTSRAVVKKVPGILYEASLVSPGDTVLTDNDDRSVVCALAPPLHHVHQLHQGVRRRGHLHTNTAQDCKEHFYVSYDCGHPPPPTPLVAPPSQYVTRLYTTYQEEPVSSHVFTYVFNTRSVHMYCHNKVSPFSPVVLITSYCVRSSKCRRVTYWGSSCSH